MHHRTARPSWITVGVLLGSCFVFACSPDSSSTAGTSSGGTEAEGSGPTGSAGTGGGSGEGGSGQGVTVAVGTGAGGEAQGTLVIEPQNPALDVEFGGPAQTVQFTATRGGSPVNGVAWFLSTPEAGTITTDGLFTTNGLAGGEITVGARLDDDTATTTLTLRLHVEENPGALTPQDQDTLSNPAPGQTDPQWSIWYPYANTVFPRGVPAPSWQSSTSAQPATAYYLKITSTNGVYEGFFQGGANPRPSQAAWDALGSTTDGSDMTVELSKLVGGVKVGPLTSAMRIARGSLKGTIYYNTYDSQLAADPNGFPTGAIMRIRGNSATPEVLIGQCTVCHSVASDGSTVAAANHSSPTWPGGTFDLANDGASPVWIDAELAAFAALYPQGGEVLVTNGAPGNGLATDLGWGPNTPGTSHTDVSRLHRRDGTRIDNSGIEAHYAQTPVFSHDGSKLAFYDRPASGGSGALAIMDFSLQGSTFTNFQTLVTASPGRHTAWPAFTPDGASVIYQDGTGDALATWGQNTARLVMVDIASKTCTDLANANGDAYVPQGARDQNLNYEPTLLPIASGGYFWVMFTSRRTYGNTLTGTRDQTKRLWVSAIDLNAVPGVDPSHPAFYIEGQEITSGNSRGFWALDPCRQDGEGCESGDQCCNGFCNPSANDPNVFVCGQPDGSCSDEFESCESAADCCDPAMECINGRCAQEDPIPG